MPEFITNDQLNTYLVTMIESADKYLWLISPFIKLNERIKFHLNKLKGKPETELVIVFGKNPDDLSKSLSNADLKYFQEFPNVKILHVNNLHAKFYGSEYFSIITSMNLYEFSQVNNLEAGIVLYPKNSLKKLADLALPETVFDSSFSESHDFFSNVIEQGHVIFQKQPNYKKSFLGLVEKFDGTSSVIQDATSTHFSSKQHSDSFTNKNATPIRKPEEQYGFCIRTGVQIPFDPSRPFCYEAYLNWANYSNWDYPEKYCHRTGQKSFGNTSMRNPIL